MLKFGAILYFIFGLFLVGCQALPETKTYSEKPNFKKTEGQQASKVQIRSETILIDARPSFAYALSHPSGAISLPWADFSQKEEPFRGRLEKDLFFHARRLARMGIGIDAEVLVLGEGSKGAGEEGRVAWTLRRLGISNVRFAAISDYRFTMTSEVPAPRAEASLWKPIDSSVFEITREQLVSEDFKNEEKIWLLDLRQNTTQKISSCHLPVSLFTRLKVLGLSFENTYEKTQNLELILSMNHLQKSDRILVLDELAQHAAGMTLRLHELGYFKASNFVGGAVELCSKQKTKIKK